MKRFVSFTTSDDNNTFFYPINDIVSAKFYSQNELNNKLTLELRTKTSTDIEVFYFDNARDYQDAIDAFNDL